MFTETWTVANGSTWPAQWTTEVAGTSALVDVQNNKGRMVTGTDPYGKAAARNLSALTLNDYLLLVDVVIPTLTEWYFFVHVRGSSSSSNVYKLLSSYQIRYTSFGGAVVVDIWTVDPSGVEAPIGGGAVSGTPVAGDTIRIAVDVAGTSPVALRQKAWKVGTAEPGWDTFAPATAYTGQFFRFSVQGGDNATSEEFLWDDLTINAPFTGTATPLEVDDTINATGTFTITGTGNSPEADDTMVASGVSGASGTGDPAEANDTMVASGTAGQVSITGTVAVTETDDTLAGAGVQTVVGTVLVCESSNYLIDANGQPITDEFGQPITDGSAGDEDTVVAVGTFTSQSVSGRRPILVRT